MDNDRFFISLGMVRKISLDDAASWYIESYEEIEQFPVKECAELFKKTKATTESVCIEDLDVRCDALIDLLDKSRGNSKYQMELTEKLKVKCNEEDRRDLSVLLESAVDRRKLRDAQIKEELKRLKKIK